VLAAVETAARVRRTRETSRLLWRIAPIVSAAAVLVAVVVRWRHAPAVIPFAMLAVAGLGWIVYAYARRRRVPVSDRTAAAIDDEAQLGGELRSAAWFATRGTTDPWAGFHLGRAAERLESTDFARLYPPVRAPRARVATGVMIATAFLVVAIFPQRPHVDAAAGVKAPPAPETRKVLPLEIDGVPPSLPQELEDLLSAIETGTLSPQRVDSALLSKLSTLLALKDPRVLAALARAMAADRKQAGDAESMKDLADRVKRDAAMTPPSDVRAALEDLSKKLSDPESDMDVAGMEKSDEAQASAGVDLASPPPQSSRDASAIDGIGMVTLSKQEAADPNAPPGVGAGGGSSSPGTGGTMAEMAKSLRHEIIEAHEDDVSGDVHSEARRKTERGSAATTFTRSAAGQSDGTRAAARLPVPEARRAGIQTYFTRKQ
jgi:hypothetical protein